MSKFRYRSCSMTDLAVSAGVDVRTFRSWLTPTHLQRMQELGHTEKDRKLRPKVVEYLLNEFLPESHS